jgi:1-phosphatidylinositol-4-phosphate 5-kinase
MSQIGDDSILVLNEDISVKEYSPDVFDFLRIKDGFGKETLRKSLDPEINKSMVFKAGESKGKSGSFFFFSKDNKFIIKTMTEDDFRAFMNLLRSYVRHICENPKSLIARVYGVYKIQMAEMKPVRILIMGNTMQVQERSQI